MFMAESDLILNPIEWKLNIMNEKNSNVCHFSFEIRNGENWNSDCQTKKNQNSAWNSNELKKNSMRAFKNQTMRIDVDTTRKENRTEIHWCKNHSLLFIR